MNTAYSSLCILNSGLAENIGSLTAHGADNIELMMDGAERDGFSARKAWIQNALRNLA